VTIGRGVVRLVAATVVAGVVLAGMAMPAVVGVGALSGQIGATAMSTVENADAGRIDAAGMPLVTTVLDRNGGPLATLYDQYRLPVTYDQIAPSMLAAIVAIEDRRFFTDAGLDPQAVARALVHDAGGSGNVQGASTITQQYVKNYLINVVDRNNPVGQRADRADTLARKIQEAAIALRLARAMSKQDVLTGYLNVVELTNHVFGVGAAAQAYFGTTADKLTVPQAALLAGMVNNPNLYDPYDHPDQALSRRNVVIDAMVQVGSISPADGTAAKAAPLGIVAKGPAVPGGTCQSAAADAGFFCAYVVDYLEQAGFTADQLVTGGYTITTTLDPADSATIKETVDHNVPTTQDGVANTFALIKPGSTDHQVLAMVANRNYGTDPKQGETLTNIVENPSNVFGSGSSFKIFTTAAALEEGTVGFDTPLPNPYTQCFPMPHAACYPVHNDSPDFPDPVSLQTALAISPNVAFVGLEQRTGIDKVVRMAERLGLRDTMASNDAGGTPITDPDDPRSKDPQYNQPQSSYFKGLPSFTLGNSPVSTLEMANVSATILSDGVWCPPTPVLTMTDRNGQPVRIDAPPCQQVVNPGVARTVAAGLSQDSISGTSAAAAHASGWHHPDIGKTGTTQTSESVAFVGGVDGYAGASFVFADGPKPRTICPGNPVHLGNCGHGAFGGTVAAPPYYAALNKIIGDRPDVPIPDADPDYLQQGDRGDTVPDVLGQTRDQASAAVQGAGYPVTVQVLASTAPGGQVIAVSPQGNLDGGTPVTLYVSSGSP
jgi:membrane peptidoglycan carboxypeptidase